MVFSSIPFIFMFLPIFALFYYAVPFKAKNYVLLVFSLIFYAWGEPIYILLMLVVTVINFIAGLLINHFDNDNFKRKLVIISAVILSIAALCYFKYTDFLIDIINGIIKADIPHKNIRLPIGISFFTFQTLSYTIDLYKREIEVEKNYAFFLMYVSMFPQLIAGPIVRFATVQSELRNRRITVQGFCDGFFRFCLGFFKKTLIANQMGMLWESFNLMDTSNMSFLGSWLGLLSFTLQLYFDFSAYSDMAIGMGQMMGFHFLENFNYPISSLSITDFWRRWHISMSTWFRDYIYIPLGGNRCGRVKRLRNILIVWFTTGLWHGASWNFVLWGMFHAFFLLMEKNIYGKFLEKLPKIIKNIYSIIIVVAGFGIFAMTDFHRIFDYFKVALCINKHSFVGADFYYYFNNFKIIILIAVLAAYPIYPYLRDKLYVSCNKRLISIAQAAFLGVFICLFLISVSGLVADSYSPFLYFRF